MMARIHDTPLPNNPSCVSRWRSWALAVALVMPVCMSSSCAGPQTPTQTPPQSTSDVSDGASGSEGKSGGDDAADSENAKAPDAADSPGPADTPAGTGIKPATPAAKPKPPAAPPVRRAGTLLVEEPPRAATASDTPKRMRSHVEGGLAQGSERVWVGPSVPSYIPLQVDTTELFLLDLADEGHFVLYRDPYGASSCSLGTDKNCRYEARFYRAGGRLSWTMGFETLWSRLEHLEIHDIQLSGGVVYFNEACQSYSRSAGGKCSSLVAVDPKQGQVLWRTEPLMSNHRFLLLEDVIIAGYGFTAEVDYLHLLRRSDGELLDRKRLRSAPVDIQRDSDGEISVVLHSGERRSVEIVTRGRDDDEDKLRLKIRRRP